MLDSADSGGKVRKILLGCALALAFSAAQARDLSFEDRVRAQTAIDRVYYAHQIGATLPFEQALPREVLERKVRTYLKQSAALEQVWNTPVTAEALRGELERIVRRTRMPERLAELYEALDGDAFLIEECLVRPVLVDRLTRSFFAQDERFHGEERRTAEALRVELASGRIDPLAEHSARTVVDFVPTDPERSAEVREPQRIELSPEDLERWRALLPERSGEIGPMRDEGDAFVVRVVLERRSDGLRVASYATPKQGWDEWWVRVAGDLDELSVAAVAAGGAVPATSGAAPPCNPEGSWQALAPDDVPEPRSGHSVVWTGSLMIVWGGNYEGFYTNTGGRYDPVTDSWTPTSTIGAPSDRASATAVWTGSSMIVWGGVVDYNAELDTGGRYDPLTDTWTAMTMTGAPSARYGHAAVWTGSLMVIWGGGAVTPPITVLYFNTGGRYDPVTDSWMPTSSVDAPAARAGHTFTWIGNRMVVWGGWDGGYLNSGGRYDPVTDSWTPTSTDLAPTARYGHTAAWTGSILIVWGGDDATPSYGLDTGGRYNPSTDSWTAISTAGAPAGRNSHSAVWTGSRMIVWGGLPQSGNSTPLNSGGRYNPATDGWTPTSMVGAPTPRVSHAAVWTGDLMIVWGGDGNGSSTTVNTGARYNPMTDSWTPTKNSTVAPRYNHTAVWTGNHMIVWGGVFFGALNTGGRYDPVTDHWTPTSMVHAPSGRTDHTAVWTGDRMIVWGGDSGPTVLNTGGRYDPVTDGWTPTSTIFVPTARQGHTVVWTGSHMIIWGGSNLNTGGRYDPLSDSWTPTSTVGAPVPRADHTAIWTGSKMVLWGGYRVEGPPLHWLSSGGRYNPLTNSWTPTSTTGAPEARSDHTAIWTGSKMVVWGGDQGVGSVFATGGRYDPATDGWSFTSTLGVPMGRYFHTAVWTGAEMVVWGGSAFCCSSKLNTGGRYDPDEDSWTPTTPVNAPAARALHTAVWTGSVMLVWGGYKGSNYPWAPTNTGGAYLPGQTLDNDGDGLSVCQGDCNDADATAFDVPHEIENLRWSTADVLVWNSDASNSGASTHYDVMYGGLGGVSYFETGRDDVSMAQDVPDPQTVDASPEPASAEGWFYLVRGANVCGAGRYETATDGSDRQTTICP